MHDDDAHRRRGSKSAPKHTREHCDHTARRDALLCEHHHRAHTHDPLLHSQPRDVSAPSSLYTFTLACRHFKRKKNKFSLIRPLPQAFEYVGMSWAPLVISIGAIASLITWYLRQEHYCISSVVVVNHTLFPICECVYSLYSSMFPMPRVVYSLASDGLIFRWLSIVIPRLKTPVMAALISGIFSGKLSKFKYF